MSKRWTVSKEVIAHESDIGLECGTTKATNIASGMDSRGADAGFSRTRPFISIAYQKTRVQQLTMCWFKSLHCQSLVNVSINVQLLNFSVPYKSCIRVTSLFTGTNIKSSLQEKRWWVSSGLKTGSMGQAREDSMFLRRKVSMMITVVTRSSKIGCKFEKKCLKSLVFSLERKGEHTLTGWQFTPGEFLT